MAKIAYKKYQPQNSNARILRFFNSIIEEFQADGFGTQQSSGKIEPQYVGESLFFLPGLKVYIAVKT